MPAYSKTTWVNGTTPAINATNLNKIEQGIADAVRKDGSEAMSAQLVTIAGNPGTPAIAPTGDSNTGIFFPAADTIAFSEGSAEVMRITSAGSVGVGDFASNNPITQFSVSNITGGVMSVTTKRAAGSNASPINLSYGFYGYLDNEKARITATERSANTNASDLSFLVSDSSSVMQTRMYISTTGNVGIGTTSPTSQLHVYNNGGAASSMVETNTTGGDVKIALKTNGTGGRHWYWQTGDNGSGLNGRLRLWDSTAGAERLNIDSNGYLLIGYTTSNGAYPLQVNGQIFATSSTIATSDGRYKKDIVSLDGALDIVAALNPVQFNWKEHPVHKFNTEVPTIGFIAQEVAEVLKDKAYLTSVIKKSECTWETETGEVIEREVTRDVETQVEREVVEEVDGEEIARTITETVIEQVTEIVNEPVKEVHTEEFYGIAESNMIAILTKAIQELNAKVEALEAQLAGN